MEATKPILPTSTLRCWWSWSTNLETIAVKVNSTTTGTTNNSAIFCNSFIVKLTNLSFAHKNKKKTNENIRELTFWYGTAKHKYMIINDVSSRIPTPFIVNTGTFSHCLLTTGSPYQVYKRQLSRAIMYGMLENSSVLPFFITLLKVNLDTKKVYIRTSHGNIF